jgi:hypothetical protein
MEFLFMETHGDILTEYRILSPTGQVGGSNPPWDAIEK